jgi:hypothetical protein
MDENKNNFGTNNKEPIPFMIFMQQQEHLVRYNLKEISL